MALLEVPVVVCKAPVRVLVEPLVDLIEALEDCHAGGGGDVVVGQNRGGAARQA